MARKNTGSITKYNAKIYIKKFPFSLSHRGIGCCKILICGLQWGARRGTTTLQSNLQISILQRPMDWTDTLVGPCLFFSSASYELMSPVVLFFFIIANFTKRPKQPNKSYEIPNGKTSPCSLIFSKQNIHFSDSYVYFWGFCVRKNTWILTERS